VLLGAIGNDKPSAIFRVRGLDKTIPVTTSGAGDADEMVDEITTLAPNGADDADSTTIVILGISIEPLATVQAALSTLPSIVAAATSPRPGGGVGAGTLVLAGTKPSTLAVARRIIKNAFNYLSSFAVKVHVPGQGMQDAVPLRRFQDWWAKFEKKMEMDPGFLEREESD